MHLRNIPTTFYHIWIPHYAHVAEPLYGLLKKGHKFEWGDEHTESIRKMKEALAATPALRKAIYGKDTLIYVTVDTSSTGIRWVINQEDDDGTRFGTKVLSERQRGYAQVKRELGGIVSAVKADKDYLIGTEVIIETDCLPILGMVSGCATPDLAMLRWIAYISPWTRKYDTFPEKTTPWPTCFRGQGSMTRAAWFRRTKKSAWTSSRRHT